MWGNQDEEEKEVLKREWNDNVIRAQYGRKKTMACQRHFQVAPHTKTIDLFNAELPRM